MQFMKEGHKVKERVLWQARVWYIKMMGNHADRLMIPIQLGFWFKGQDTTEWVQLLTN